MFETIRRYIYLLDTRWEQKIQSLNEESILNLEEFVEKNFQIALPTAYKSFLAHMGRNDAGVLTGYFDKDEWRYFNPQNDMSWGAMRYCNISEQFYPFFYQIFREEGFGFSPGMDNLEQIVVMLHGKKYYTSDTFSKLWCYLSFLYILRLSISQLEEIKTPIDSTACNCTGTYFSYLIVRSASLLEESEVMQIINNLENNFSIQEYWFSNNRRFALLNPNGETSDAWYSLSRYVGFSNVHDFGLHIISDRSRLYISAMGSGNQYIKEIIDSLPSTLSVKITQAGKLNNH